MAGTCLCYNHCDRDPMQSLCSKDKYFDTKITYQPNDANWFVSVYGKNLANDQFVGTWAAGSALQGGNTFSTYTDPRTWGVQFGTSF